MRCEELMRRPVQSCREGDSVQSAALVMRDANIGFLPVCDERKRVVGVVTDRDLAVRVLAGQRAPSSTTVGEVMTREVICCRPEDTLVDAQRLMARHMKSRVVVTDAGERLLGVVSLADVAGVASLLAAETLRCVTGREVFARPGRRTDDH